MVKADQYIIGEQFLRNYNGALTVKDEDKKITRKNYQSFGQSWHGIRAVSLR